VKALDDQDFTTVSSLMAPDAAFAAEDITNVAARMALKKSTLRVLPDEQGDAHLAMTGSGTVHVVAVDGAELESGSYTCVIELRRDSRRDEWRVWGFELRPR
jgi:hypothetical protein